MLAILEIQEVFMNRNIFMLTVILKLLNKLSVFLCSKVTRIPAVRFKYFYSTHIQIPPDQLHGLIWCSTPDPTASWEYRWGYIKDTLQLHQSTLNGTPTCSSLSGTTSDETVTLSHFENGHDVTAYVRQDWNMRAVVNSQENMRGTPTWCSLNGTASDETVTLSHFENGHDVTAYVRQDWKMRMTTKSMVEMLALI